MATVKPPIGEQAPFCKCGCGDKVNWGPGKGWMSYIKGHASRGKPSPRKGAKLTKEHKDRISNANRLFYKGKRNREKEKKPGPGVYATWEFREARKKLVDGKSCCKCGTMENVHAHHIIPGDDSTLIPVCRKCHPTIHAPEGSKGKNPPPGEEAPICSCGCGLPVRWKKFRGWAKYKKGHGNAKIPAGTRLQQAPLCACGCGEQTKFIHGKGWNKYKRGHRQRIEGHYTKRKIK